MARQPCTYIMANRRNGTIYIGVTSDLGRRAHEHRASQIAGFTKRYGCKCLVWYQYFETMREAIAREKQLKGGSRRDKLILIEAENPEWVDLYEQLAQG